MPHVYLFFSYRFNGKYAEKASVFIFLQAHPPLAWYVNVSLYRGATLQLAHAVHI